MHFQIYIPNAPPGVDPKILAGVGLADLAGDATFLDCAIPARAEGQCPLPGRGALISWPSAGGVPKHAYRPDEQTWWPSLDQLEDRPRYYVGVWNDALPSPADLARRRQIGGHAVRLLDGNEWIVPAAARLPVVLTDDLHGHPAWEVQDAFRGFWNESRQMYVDLVVNAIVDDRVETVVHCDWRDYAAKALNFNYRFPRELLTRLRLCGETELYKLCLATVDGHQIAEFEKGKEPGPPKPA